MEPKKQERPHNGLKISLIVLLGVFGIYWLYMSFSNFLSLTNSELTDRAKGAFALLAIFSLLVGAGSIVLFIFALVKLIKGECPQKFLNFALLINPAAYFLRTFAIVCFYNGEGYEYTVLNSIFFILWNLLAIVAAILGLINVGKKGRWFFLSSELIFMGYALYLIFANFGGNADLGTGDLICVCCMIAYYVIYILRNVFHGTYALEKQKECCCSEKEGTCCCEGKEPCDCEKEEIETEPKQKKTEKQEEKKETQEEK